MDLVKHFIYVAEIINLFSNSTSSDVCVVLVTSMCFIGTENDSYRHVQFDSGFHVMVEMKSPVQDQQSILAPSSSRVESS